MGLVELSFTSFRQNITCHPYPVPKLLYFKAEEEPKAIVGALPEALEKSILVMPIFGPELG
jgi:hypothetical protein